MKNTAHRHGRQPFAAACVAISLGFLAAAPAFAGQGTASRPVTFSKHVAPILQRSCQSCHRAWGDGADVAADL